MSTPDPRLRSPRVCFVERLKRELRAGLASGLALGGLSTVSLVEQAEGQR